MHPRRPNRLGATALAAIRPHQQSSLLPIRLHYRPAIESARSRRRYHSYDHPPPPGPFSAPERAILAAAYKHVAELGFSQKALALGARDSGHPDISASLLPDGPFSLIRYHLVEAREALAGRNAEIFVGDEAAAGLSARVERLTWERLLGNKGVLHRWQEALAIMAQPTYVPASLKELALLADEIWFLAGDAAVDPSWYTKRASLSTIYVSAELFMTNDRSPDFAETRQFLRRRFDEVAGLGRVVGALGQWAGFTANAGVNVLRSKGVRI